MQLDHVAARIIHEDLRGIRARQTLDHPILYAHAIELSPGLDDAGHSIGDVRPRRILARSLRHRRRLLAADQMDRRPDLGFGSYDRFFPNQDTLPHGGFGNLIALPLQKEPRDLGNSVFLDDQMVPYGDQ